jgi:hypothetical protein
MGVIEPHVSQSLGTKLLGVFSRYHSGRQTPSCISEFGIKYIGVFHHTLKI